MERYKDFAPTPFDSRGTFLNGYSDDTPDRQEWFIAPCSQTRDSDCLDQSNFVQCLDALGGESETVEVHRFGHWGPGWFELILIDPTDAQRVAIGEELERRLEDYPILDDEDFSRREWEESEEDWNNWARRDFIDYVCKEYGLTERARDLLDDCDSAELREWFNRYACECCPLSGSAIRSFHASRTVVGRFIRDLRKMGVS